MPAEAGDGTRVEGGAIHDDRIHLDLTVPIEMRAAPGVGIVLHDPHGRLHRVQRPAPPCNIAQPAAASQHAQKASTIASGMLLAPP